TFDAWSVLLAGGAGSRPRRLDPFNEQRAYQSTNRRNAEETRESARGGSACKRPNGWHGPGTCHLETCQEGSSRRELWGGVRRRRWGNERDVSRRGVRARRHRDSRDEERFEILGARAAWERAKGIYGDPSCYLPGRERFRFRG